MNNLDVSPLVDSLNVLQDLPRKIGCHHEERSEVYDVDLTVSKRTLIKRIVMLRITQVTIFRELMGSILKRTVNPQHSQIL